MSPQSRGPPPDNSRWGRFSGSQGGWLASSLRQCVIDEAGGPKWPGQASLVSGHPLGGMDPQQLGDYRGFKGTHGGDMAAPVCPWGQTSHWPSRRLEGVLSWQRAPHWGAASAGLGSCPASVVGPRSGTWGPSPHTEEVALISTPLPPSFGGQRPLSSPSHHTLHQGNRELKCLPGHPLPSGMPC